MLNNQNMASVKEKIIQEIQNIEDEALLTEIYQLLQNVYNVQQVLKINAEQRACIEEARKDYYSGKFYSTDALFNGLIDE
jgi:hypothetical protein